MLARPGNGASAAAGKPLSDKKKDQHEEKGKDKDKKEKRQSDKQRAESAALASLENEALCSVQLDTGECGDQHGGLTTTASWSESIGSFLWGRADQSCSLPPPGAALSCLCFALLSSAL